MKIIMPWVLILILLFSGTVFATQQIQDQVIFYDKAGTIETSLFPTPLERYFYENKIPYPFKMHGTANYRGHVAIWEVTQNQMYLVKVLVDKKEIILNEFFPKIYQVAGKIKASWFTGMLGYLLMKIIFFLK